MSGAVGLPSVTSDRAAGGKADTVRCAASRHLGGTMGAVSQRFSCDDEDDLTRGIEAATTAVRSGRLVVLPTDTVYGVGADAFDADAVRRLLRAKGRGPDKPPPVLIAARTTLDALVTNLPMYARELIVAMWPGPLTLVCRQQPSLTWDLGDNRSTVAIRMPESDAALRLVQSTGPLAVSSANVSGQPAATLVEEAQEMLGESVAVYLDGGPMLNAVASTILDVTGPTGRMLRQGAVSLERLQEFDERIQPVEESTD